MKLKTTVFFNVGAEGIEKVTWVLRKCGLLDSVELNREGTFAGSGSVSLPDEDQRIPELIEHLRNFGEEALLRKELVLTPKELDELEWLDCRIVTAGLAGGIGYDQAYDHTGACELCGAGATPIPPLMANLPKMGRKHVDQTAHDGHLVVSRALVENLMNAGMTGFTVRPVQAKRRGKHEDHFVWLDVTEELPPMSDCHQVQVTDDCPICARTGRYDVSKGITRYCYEELAPTADFNRTWEYFGYWQRHTVNPRERVGGARGLVISRRVRALFKQVGVRNVKYRPVWKGPSMKDVFASNPNERAAEKDE